MKKLKKIKIGKVSLEKFYHFNCGYCHKWWGIGDALAKRSEWFCPWCGEKQIIKNIKK